MKFLQCSLSTNRCRIALFQLGETSVSEVLTFTLGDQHDNQHFDQPKHCILCPKKIEILIVIMVKYRIWYTITRWKDFLAYWIKLFQ